MAMTDTHPADRYRGLPRRHLGRTAAGSLTAALALVTSTLAGAAEAPAAAPVAPVEPGAAAPAAAAADVPLSACADPDHGLPVITDVAVTPRVIDVRRHRAT